MTSKTNIVLMINKVCRLIHIQNYSAASATFNALLTEISKLEEFIVQINENNSHIGNLMSLMLSALENGDMVLLADYLEEALLPWVISNTAVQEAVEEGRFLLEPTSSGLWTLKDIMTGLYLHSNVNPCKAEEEWVDFATDLAAKEYAVWGLGLGYHVRALLEKTKGTKIIKVFEEEKDIIELCGKYGEADIFDRDNLEIVWDKNGRLFSDYISKKAPGLLIHYPSVKKISDEGLLESMKQLFLGWNSTVLLKDELFLNFEKNITAVSENVDVLRPVFNGKKVLYAGGGPSLSGSFDFIKRNREDLVIITATTVLKKLLSEGITPDYAIVLDPQERTYGHMAGVPKNEVPLIFASTAYWRFAGDLTSKKYIVFQKQYEPAERLAEETGVNTYATGGSVTTIALDIMIKLGAASIFFTGVDMGFPGGKTHVSGTMDERTLTGDNLIPVPSVDGKTVFTDEKMLYYLRWIEKEIEKNPGPEYINMSDCGAKINGMKSFVE